MFIRAEGRVVHVNFAGPPLGETFADFRYENQANVPMQADYLSNFSLIDETMSFNAEIDEAYEGRVPQPSAVFASSKI